MIKITNEILFYQILLILNIIIYGICILLIIKRKKYTCISMRSPKLLITGNFGGLIVSIILILSQILKDNSNLYIINSFFYIFQGMMIISFFMRCQRIINCCNINYDEREDIHKFYEKRYLYKEGFYVNVMFNILLVFSLLLFIYVVISKDAITLFFLEKKNNKKNVYLWLIINFIEIFVLIRYAYLMFIKKVKQKIIFELIIFLIIWYIYFNLVQWYTHKNNGENKNDEFYIIIISLIILYINLFLNGIFPIILSFCYHTSISFYFGQSSMNNSLYLFLSNEDCYKFFHNYLSKNNPQSIYYLQFYSHVLLYKFHFLNNEEESIKEQELISIYNKYFRNINSSNKFGVNAFNTIKNNYGKRIHISAVNLNPEIFDSALNVAYEKLYIDFKKFQKSIFFEDLADYLNLHSYIQCKMYNTGLIKKY